nr:hypothetical protein [Tanacetum cinerariifolium]
MKKIIKEQVKSQFKAQVTRILPRIEEAVNAQLEAEVLIRSFHSSRTSYAVAAYLSKMELKNILIEKMEGNKSIQRSDKQQNLYKALVEAYDADKTILDTYGESTILKRRREDDDQEGPSAGSDRGSKRQREGEEHASASTPSEQATESADDQPIIQTTQHPEWFSQPRRPPTPDRDWNKSVPTAQGQAQSWISALAKQTDSHWIRTWCRLEPDLRSEKLSNLTVEERFAFNVSLRMFTRSIVIQRRVEDLQLGVESYQKRLNLTRPDMYRSDLKRRKAYTAYSNPRGFIYQNKDKKNKLMRIDELHKFSGGTLNDVRNTLDDHLKWIRM